MKVETFTVAARGIGRADYSKAIERSVQPFITPTLRQNWMHFSGTFILDTFPFPSIWIILLTMPQEDGSWGWLASSIHMHFFEIGMSIRTNHLVTVGLLRWASIADFFAGIVAQRSPQIFSYGKANITFSKGIPTQEGSLYSIMATGWPDTPTFEVTVTATGMATDLTAPWME